MRIGAVACAATLSGALLPAAIRNAFQHVRWQDVFDVSMRIQSVAEDSDLVKAAGAGH